MLKELFQGPGDDFDSAVGYSRDVLKRPWPDLEPMLVALMPAPDLFQLQSCIFFEFIEYARYHDGSPTLELEILAQGYPAAAFAYAACGTRRRWQGAEPLILSGDTAARPALSTVLGDILDISQWASSWESQAVIYARLFLPSGWPELEDKMVRRECHPRVAYEYAVNVLRGPLPQAIKNWLVLDEFDREGKEYVDKYLDYEKAHQAHASQGDATPSPPP